MEIFTNLVALVIGVVMVTGTMVVLIVPVTIWRGYVLSKLWLWLIVPVFPNAPVLSIVTAIGVSIVFALFTSGLKQADYKKDDDESITTVFFKALSHSFTAPAVALLFGYIVSLYI